MKKLLILLALIASLANAAAPTVLRAEDQTGNVVRLLQDPCAEPTASLIEPKDLKKFHNATLLFRGKNFKACWVYVPEAGGVIGIVDETGDVMTVPAGAFAPEEML